LKLVSATVWTDLLLSTLGASAMLLDDLFADEER
jgi:hypothetical protein